MDLGSFFSHNASVALVRSRLGRAFDNQCRRVEIDNDKYRVDGWWTSDSEDLAGLAMGEKGSEKVVTLMFIHGQFYTHLETCTV